MAGSGRLALWTVPGHGWVRGSGPAVLSRLRDAAVVRPGFLSAAEEETLSGELEPELRRRRYEYDHWDAAIHGFRETEKSRWSEASRSILQRVQAAAFGPGQTLLSSVHVLDLEPRGYIKPHVDSIKCVLSSSSVDPRLLACPCCLPASCGWCTPRSQGSGWNSCWSRAPSTSLGVRPVMTSPTRSFGMKSPFLGSVGFPGADASP
ncbi:alpha-ketoglutarate-dependent dioxygenase alkB homolog 7, mitochondrial isoform X2 [Eubalaena glacialis]|uniref:alpha-ketoglutarate-dependent dioxygenase alkB homolog 7, mitochondrial isoform X2 n=1 Tax=Eubalaena glacialis TaxID=27606 RepID=UPI002A5B095A|nr:alpha-ketoglutarate-dependent dioxygenase alkB homolog 7, mitochondrial isoform X2 [Eubalaena glacialis]